MIPNASHSIQVQAPQPSYIYQTSPIPSMVVVLALGTLSLTISALATIRLQGTSLGVFNALGTIGHGGIYSCVAFGMGAHVSVWIFAVKKCCEVHEEVITSCKADLQLPSLPSLPQQTPSSSPRYYVGQKKEPILISITTSTGINCIPQAREKLTKDWELLIKGLSISFEETFIFNGSRSEIVPYMALIEKKENKTLIQLMTVEEYKTNPQQLPKEDSLHHSPVLYHLSRQNNQSNGELESGLLSSNYFDYVFYPPNVNLYHPGKFRVFSKEKDDQAELTSILKKYNEHYLSCGGNEFKAQRSLNKNIWYCYDDGEE